MKLTCRRENARDVRIMSLSEILNTCTQFVCCLWICYDEHTTKFTVDFFSYTLLHSHNFCLLFMDLAVQINAHLLSNLFITSCLYVQMSS